MREQSEKAGLKFNIQKPNKITVSSHFMPNRRGKVKAVTDFLFPGSQVTVDDDCSHEIKRCLLLWRKAMTNLDSILRSGNITLPKKSYSQSYSFSSSHILMWEPDCKEGWALKNWWFQTAMLFKGRLFLVPWISRSNQLTNFLKENNFLKEIKVMRLLERITDSMDMNLNNFREIWRTGLPYRLHAAVHGVAKIRTCLSDGTARA